MLAYLRKIARQLLSSRVLSAHPNGHFYSPVVDPVELGRRFDAFYPSAQPTLGIDFQDESHQGLITDALLRYMPDYDYPERGPADQTLEHFYTQNSQFSWLDARALFCFLRHWQPARVVEVGSGYSTLLLRDIQRRFLPNLQIQCIEPYPRAFLRNPSFGVELIQQPVQRVPMHVFESLGANDLLFIDSSHVCKTGSDVNHLFFNVLPRLKPGVRIHVHDVFLPFEYPKNWVLEENRSWNEQYLLQALLMYSNAFEVVFGNCYAFWKFPEQIVAALNLPNAKGFGGGSFYLQRR
jgi:hypothetical protein